MALGSWMGIYIQVSDDLMAERREQELLLFMAIARHADRLGFCFPGHTRLRDMRHISQPVLERRIAFLEERGLIKMTESWDWRRRQPQYDFQVSPRAMYIRPEFEEYCLAVFDGIQERDDRTEKMLLENHFSTNDSQPETEPEVVTRLSNQSQEPGPGTRHSNQRGRALTKQGRNASTMRNEDQRDSAKQPTANNATAHRDNHPQAVPPSGDEFDALLSPTIDDDRLIQEIKHAVSTTQHQAAAAVATYPREEIVHWLKQTAIRRAKKELGKPGGWFFSMLKRHAAVLPEALDEYELP